MFWPVLGALVVYGIAKDILKTGVSVGFTNGSSIGFGETHRREMEELVDRQQVLQVVASHIRDHLREHHDDFVSAIKKGLKLCPNEVNFEDAFCSGRFPKEVKIPLVTYMIMFRGFLRGTGDPEHWADFYVQQVWENFQDRT